MKMNLWVGLALTGLFSTTAVQGAFDGTIGVSDTLGRTGNGGPFTITVMTAATAAMTEVASQGSLFLSFCVEKTETIDLSGNQGYKVNVAQQAVNGGGGPNPDPLSLATAWLYSQFRASGNTGLNSVFALAGRTIDQGRNDLQQAIWYLENEQSSPLLGNYLVNAAVAALTGYGVTLANVLTIDANGAFGVRVLNVYDSSGINKLQDQLALVGATVPEPSTYLAGALLLIPVLAQIRRWKRAA